MTGETYSLPMVALRGLTILPEEVRHFDVSREKSLLAIEEAVKNGQKLFVSAQKDLETEEPGAEDVYLVGCVVTIRQVVKLPKKMSRVLVSGEARASLVRLDSETPYLQATVVELPDDEDVSEEQTAENPMNLEAMIRGLQDVFKEYLLKNPKLSKELGMQVEAIRDLKHLVDVIAANMPFAFEDAQELLEETNLMRRYELLIYKIVNEIQAQKVKEEIQSKVKERVDKNQREYILREELKVIREELGDDNTMSDADEFQQAVDALKASKEVKEKLNKEIKRFRNSMNSPAEVGVIRTYIETMLEMPWDKTCKEHKDIAFARQVLDEDHYGLEKVKERVLEYLAVRALTKKGEAPIICLVGPPGTGKTSIAKSLSRALKKPYVRISLGGVRDEAEIRGHRKTYVGAMPGRIANGIKQAGVKNPLMLLDEIDKVSNDYKGDTFSALLEVLDGEQNNKFVDHYLEVPIDLSEVLFITTANSLQTIPRPLLDRMEVIEVTSYTENEKLHIAQEHLIPKQIEKHGLKADQVTISKNAIWKMARNYTKEAGVRNLERLIGQICRKTARLIMEDGKEKVTGTGKNLESFLGQEKYNYLMPNKKDEVGIARGLAWTQVGGDTLQIEVNIMPGKGEFVLTGQLGDVMKESAQAALSCLRSRAAVLGIPADFYKTKDIHVHFPEGAVPKDGPSAGIAVTTAMLSALTDRKIKAGIAMTGEVTLRGRVLPIGGLKEKTMAALRSGITTVLIPKDNVRDLEEIDQTVRAALRFVPVETVDQVFAAALCPERDPIREEVADHVAAFAPAGRESGRDAAVRQ